MRKRKLRLARTRTSGVTLGATTGVAVSMRQDMDQIQSVQASNNLVLNRLTASQSALSTLATSTSNFLASLITAQTAGTSQDTLVQAAQAGMQTLQDQLNASLDGQYLFAGTNSDVQPMADFFATPPSASAQAVSDAFFNKFGITPDDPPSRIFRRRTWRTSSITSSLTCFPRRTGLAPGRTHRISR